MYVIQLDVVACGRVVVWRLFVIEVARLSAGGGGAAAVRTSAINKSEEDRSSGFIVIFIKIPRDVPPALNSR